MNETFQNTNFDINPPVVHMEYDEKIKKFCGAYKEIFLMSCALLKSILKEKSNILITGAGTGSEIFYYSQYNTGWEFTAIDPSREMLDLAKKKINTHGIINKINFFKGFIHEYNSENRFDAATCILVMHFLPDETSSLAFLKCISSHLKPGAPFIFVNACGDNKTPGFQTLINGWKQYPALFGEKMDIIEEGFSSQILKRLTFLPEHKIKELLINTGFNDIERFYSGFLYSGWISFKR